MSLNIIKLQNILLDVSEVSISPVRQWDENYEHLNNSYLLGQAAMCSTYNYALWKVLLESRENQGNALDRFELINIFDTLPLESVDEIYKKINVRSKCITFDEFDDFLTKVDEEVYVELMMCLEPVQLTDIEPEDEVKDCEDEAKACEDEANKKGFWDCIKNLVRPSRKQYQGMR
jgi:hypothetical protein